MRVSSWLKFTVLAALGPQALAEVLADHGADTASLVARDHPYDLGEPHPQPGDTVSYPPRIPPAGTHNSPSYATNGASHKSNHHKRGDKGEQHYATDNNYDDHGRNLKWGEGRKLPQNQWSNPFMPHTARKEEIEKKKEDHPQKSKEVHTCEACPQASLHTRRSVQSESAPQGHIAARADDDTRSGKLGVDEHGNPIYKGRHGRSTRIVARADDDAHWGKQGVDEHGNPIRKNRHGRPTRIMARADDPHSGKLGVDEHGNPIRKSRHGRPTRIVARADDPHSGKLGVDEHGNPIRKSRHGHPTRIVARADDDAHWGKQGVDEHGNPINKNGRGQRSHRNRKVLSRRRQPTSNIPEDLQPMPPTSPKSPKSPNSSRKTKTQTSTGTGEAAPLPRDNQVYNDDGSFNKYSARRDLEARNEPKYHDTHADPSFRDKGVHMDDVSIAPHGRRPTGKGKACRAKPHRA
ncbi:hypothetical protein PgNI_06656 [Pyricularia grisea]|uniref:Uncharacterized protein n=1 Tax=Pyricularia grisea TaxID=148305 RepID=A0A6P8B4J7_PYRGI|nr:hypothetical protein PgNI_06656 [Pyricularia grisea]TLD10188.1 hypothetical protein PgNI_06656 [Pyricularia grisea]